MTLAWSGAVQMPESNQEILGVLNLSNLTYFSLFYDLLWRLLQLHLMIILFNIIVDTLIDVSFDSLIDTCIRALDILRYQFIFNSMKLEDFAIFINQSLN